MSIRFAAPPQALAVRLSPLAARTVCGIAANDNIPLVSSEATLRASLRHFAEYGLAAAPRARSKAEMALAAEDLQAYEWWLGICRTLDRRMARDLATRAKDAG